MKAEHTMTRVWLLERTSQGDVPALKLLFIIHLEILIWHQILFPEVFSSIFSFLMSRQTEVINLSQTL